MTSMYIQEINSKCYFQKNVWIKKTIGLLNSEVICFVCLFVRGAGIFNRDFWGVFETSRLVSWVYHSH